MVSKSLDAPTGTLTRAPPIAAWLALDSELLKMPLSTTAVPINRFGPPRSMPLVAVTEAKAPLMLPAVR